jgi:hypothetical protein
VVRWPPEFEFEPPRTPRCQEESRNQRARIKDTTGLFALCSLLFALCSGVCVFVSSVEVLSQDSAVGSSY